MVIVSPPTDRVVGPDPFQTAFLGVILTYPNYLLTGMILQILINGVKNLYKYPCKSVPGVIFYDYKPP